MSTMGLGAEKDADVAPYTLHPTPYSLHPTPYSLHLTPCTLHPRPCLGAEKDGDGVVQVGLHLLLHCEELKQEI